VTSFTRGITDADPEAAAAWASTMTDSGARTGQLQRIARHWLRQDPDSARSWIQSSDALSKEVRLELLLAGGR